MCYILCALFLSFPWTPGFGLSTLASVLLDFLACSELIPWFSSHAYLCYPFVSKTFLSVSEANRVAKCPTMISLGILWDE